MALSGQAIFNKLTSPTAVKAAIAECDSMGRDQFLDEYGFKPAREYVLQYRGGHYDTKAIAAVAFGYQYGRAPLRSDQCTAGKDYGHAAWALHRLGFLVSGIRYIGWPIDEVEAAVDSYFTMMSFASAGEKLVKSKHLKALAAQFPTRSLKAFEYKFQNISAVLSDLGRPWLQGFAPKSQYQALLRFVIEDRIGRRIALEEREVNELLDKPPGASKLRKTDWAKRDAENRELGKMGEIYVLEKERERLANSRRPELSAQVEWLSEKSDSYGYDIDSFDEDGKPIMIEVKTTTCNENAPFYISATEVQKSHEFGLSYRIYRVFDFLTDPKIQIYSGPADNHFELEAVSFRAKKK